MDEKKVISKQSIRSKYLAKRDALSLSQRKEKSSTITELLKKETCYREAEAVFLYMDYRSEVMTTMLAEELLASGKQIFAPRVKGFDIVFYEIRTLDDLETGYQGIREPVEKPEMLLKETVLQEKRCLVLVPGTVFDYKCHRMGYGKGFYDRFLEKCGDNVTAVGLAFSCQIAKMIPTESHDRRMDLVVTENGIIKA